MLKGNGQVIFNYLSYELFLERKFCRTPKKKKKKKSTLVS